MLLVLWPDVLRWAKVFIWVPRDGGHTVLFSKSMLLLMGAPALWEYEIITSGGSLWWTDAPRPWLRQTEQWHHVNHRTPHQMRLRLHVSGICPASSPAILCFPRFSTGFSWEHPANKWWHRSPHLKCASRDHHPRQEGFWTVSTTLHLFIRVVFTAATNISLIHILVNLFEMFFSLYILRSGIAGSWGMPDCIQWSTSSLLYWWFHNSLDPHSGKLKLPSIIAEILF